VSCRDFIQSDHKSIRFNSRSNVGRFRVLERGFLFVLMLGGGALALADDSAQNPDNGTDPTRLNRSVSASLEHLSLGGDLSQNTFTMLYTTPITDDARTALRLTVPLIQNDAAGRETYSLSDVGLSISRVLKLTQQYGIVVSGEMTFDTANETEGGAGKNVFRGTVAYVQFLPGGIILAPTLNQSNSIWGDRDRRDVNMTVLDFYIVPKLPDPKTFVTFDPAINSNWEIGAQFFSLAVTIGRALGPAFGGRSQIYVRASTFAGGERAADWGIEIGYKVLGF
jgi:hypothetical protein